MSHFLYCSGKIGHFGFEDVPASTNFEGSSHKFRIFVDREKKNSRGASRDFEGCCHLEAVHIAKRNIQHDHVWLQCLCLVNDFCSSRISPTTAKFGLSIPANASRIAGLSSTSSTRIFDTSAPHVKLNLNWVGRH